MHSFYKSLLLFIVGLTIVFSVNAQDDTKILPEISSDIILNPNIQGIEQ